MRIIRHCGEVIAEVKDAVVALGNFDGVHRGHQAVIGAAGGIAKASGLGFGVMTFEPHPRSFFNPTQHSFRLTPFRIKARHIEALGAEFMLVPHFDKEFAALSARDFVRNILWDCLKVRHVVVGHDYVFGKGRSGDTRLLQEMASDLGFLVTVIPAIKDGEGNIYSSTAVRDALLIGNCQRAAALLGRFWEIEGRVEQGDKRGRQLGFPTANLHLGEYQIPALGVYAVRAGIDRGLGTIWYDGVANCGKRPTFNKEDVTLEVHLFNANEDLYGQHLRVALVEYLRPEMKFSGLEALKAQISQDIFAAQQIHQSLTKSSR